MSDWTPKCYVDKRPREQELARKRALCALEMARWTAEKKRERAERKALRRDFKEMHREKLDAARINYVVNVLGRSTRDQKLAWIYARASHASNSDTDSVPAQVERLKKRFERDWEEKGYKLAPPQMDLITSAYKTSFQSRNGGATIFKEMQAGDVILVDKFDRAFRNLADAVNTMESLSQRGVEIDIANLGMNSTQPWYKIVVAILGAVAEMESTNKSERIKECFSRRREVGADVSPSGLPSGTKLERRGVSGLGQKPLAFRVWDTWVRSIQNSICVKADREGWTLEHVRDWLNKEVLKNTPIPKKTPHLKYPLTKGMVLRLYWWEKMYRMAGITDVRATKTIKQDFGELPKNWEKLQKLGWLELP
jgi:DNA invertase Pin-like site-specific DNA recombinase